MKYKADLERILKATLQQREPLVSEVRISDDGLLAVIQVADKYMLRRLSPLGKRFWRCTHETGLCNSSTCLFSHVSYCAHSHRHGHFFLS